MLRELRDGDTVVIESLSRLGRSVKNLAELIELCNEKNVRLGSLNEITELIGISKATLYRSIKGQVLTL